MFDWFYKKLQLYRKIESDYICIIWSTLIAKHVTYHECNKLNIT